MKRRELIRHLNTKGCKLVREGANHSWWENPTLNRRSVVPPTQKSTASSRGKSAGIWELKEHRQKLKFDIHKSKIKIPFMPLYEYELCEGDCKVCGGKFTLNRPLSA